MEDSEVHKTITDVALALWDEIETLRAEIRSLNIRLEELKRQINSQHQMVQIPMGRAALSPTGPRENREL